MTVLFDPMRGRVAAPTAGALPAGTYTAEFLGAEYLPVSEPDPMTGKGGRQWAAVAFRWKVAEGEHAGQTATREASLGEEPRVAYSPKSKYVEFAGLIMGKTLSPNDEIELKPYVGRKYLLTVAHKTDAAGNQKAWTHVANAMLIP